MDTVVNNSPPDNAREQFLRCFLAAEPEMFRTVVAIIGNIDDARDVMQQTALALWDRFDEYDSARPFIPWACRFAANIARQWLGKQRRWKAVLDDGMANELLRRREELRSQMDDRFKYLEHCLSRLPESERSLVDGYYQRQMPVTKLAQENGRTVDAIYKSLQRIRAALRGCIERSARAGRRVEL